MGTGNPPNPEVIGTLVLGIKFFGLRSELQNWVLQMPAGWCITGTDSGKIHGIAYFIQDLRPAAIIKYGTQGKSFIRKVKEKVQGNIYNCVLPASTGLGLMEGSPVVPSTMICPFGSRLKSVTSSSG